MACWPSCLACDDRLLPIAVATDSHDALVAAVMRCYNRAHDEKQYVYKGATEPLYIDQGLSDPSA